jgi:hypothetical protein
MMQKQIIILNAATSTNYSGVLRSESAYGQNMKVVAISLSFPTHIRTCRSDTRSSRYEFFS